MSCKDITTQAELDAALVDDAVTCVHIKSDQGVWLTLGDSGRKTVEAYGSATVRAYGSATVRASGSATVEAYGSATVEAYGSATVRASGSATVRASGSATVEAYDSATVEAYGSATVEASGSATVEASGSATVRASGSATVEAYDSATVRAYGTTHIAAHHRAAVTASTHVSVHLHDAQATITGGHVIDVTNLNLDDAATWADHHGVDAVDGRITLYKAVGDDLTTGLDYHDQPYLWGPGTELVCHDWRDDNECGGGLHLSPTPAIASSYRYGASRWLRCTVAVEDVRPIEGGAPKAKCRAVRVEAEVDRFGRHLPATEVATDAG